MKRRNFHLPIAFTLWVNIVEEADDGADRWASGVDIAFANEKLEKLCNSTKALTKAFGKDSAKKIRRRLDDMNAASELEVCHKLPGGYHELKGGRRGQISCVAGGGLRLIFKPASNPPPVKPDGGLDWFKVTAVIVLEITDYHD
jgi:plasmid maintenance system killer protein